ncbi:MAG: hypothetical protein ACREJQ_02110, partial [bacterium]
MGSRILLLVFTAQLIAGHCLWMCVPGYDRAGRGFEVTSASMVNCGMTDSHGSAFLPKGPCLLTSSHDALIAIQPFVTNDITAIGLNVIYASAAIAQKQDGVSIGLRWSTGHPPSETPLYLTQLSLLI